MIPDSAAAISCAGACLIEALSPERRVAVEQLVRAEGPARAVASLSSDGIGRGTRWDMLMIAIESGDSGWLRVAAALRPGADARTADALLGALSIALRRNAPGVLAMTGPTIPIEDICHHRATEGRPIDGKVFDVHTRNALLLVTDPALAAVRDTCLAVLEAHSED